MQIKKLKLHGFKSFPDKTEIQLDAPITALVGPNGCGKSNVVDAIKWVLGSQSPKSLRGNEMEDVIFKGSSSRQSLGFAKAEFVLDNSDGEIDLDYSEVSIGRKLYRSGESQYLINGEEVRLKDIDELLYDTGIGVENYSLIEQGRIDRVLDSSAKERRELIEEAAGISTFQARKREARRKLDRVQDDLDDVQNVLDELKKDIHSLKTQAGKARKYKEHKQKLDEKKLLLHIDQYQELVEEEKQLREEWEQTKEKRSEVQDKMESTLSEAEKLTQNLEELNQKRSSLKDEKNQRDKELLNVKNSIKNIQERLTSAKEDHQRLSEEDLEELAARIEELEEEIQEAQNQRSTFEDKRKELVEEKQHLDDRVDQLTARRSTHQSQRDELDNRLSEISENQQEIKRSLQDISERRDRIKENIKEFYDRKRKLTKKLDDHRNELTEISEQIEEHEHQIQRHQEGVAILHRAKHKKENEYRTVKNDLEEVSDERSELRSRIKYLESLEDQQAGLSKGTKSVLNTFDPAEHEDVLGLLGGMITFTELGHRTIQGLLDPLLEFVVVRDWPTARKVIATARESEGDVGVLVLSALEEAERTKHSRRNPANSPIDHLSLKKKTNRISTDQRNASHALKTQPTTRTVTVPLVFHENRRNGCRPLDQYLQADPPFSRLIADLLSSYGFDRTMSAADANEHLFPPGIGCASHDTVTSTNRGLVYSRGETSVEDNVVDRRRTMEDLKSRTSSLSEREERLKSSADRLESGLESVEKALSNSRSRIYETKVELKHLKERRSRMKTLIEEHEEEQSTLEQKISDQKEEDQQLEQRRDEMKTELDQLQEEKQDLEQTLDQTREKLQSVESDLQETREKKQKLDVEKAQLDEKIQNVDSLIQRHQKDRKTAQDRIESVQKRLSVLEERQEELREQLENKRSRKEELEEELDDLESELSSVRDRTSTLKERQQKKEEKREEIREAYASLQERANKLEVNLKEARANRENLEERADDHLDRDFEDALEEFDRPEEDVNREELREEVNELESTINRMGNVNLAALEQLEEKQERVDEIEKQEEDLKTSRRRLQRIIRKMKKESHKRFKTTFEQGKENFNDLFRKLFGGGKATLKAVFDDDDEDESETEEAVETSSSNGSVSSSDLLECGIEIKAQPPGKDMTNLSLLSGGERAMTSIALMMALFMLNPSAICILDEADAPLDESNLDLFIGLINEFTDLTQFLVITHKKKTITAADHVYGLTMQEDGVSQLISMDMENRVPDEYLQENPEEQPGSVAGTLAE